MKMIRTLTYFTISTGNLYYYDTQGGLLSLIVGVCLGAAAVVEFDKWSGQNDNAS